jgi:hypothetical protein
MIRCGVTSSQKALNDYERDALIMDDGRCSVILNLLPYMYAKAFTQQDIHIIVYNSTPGPADCGSQHLLFTSGGQNEAMRGQEHEETTHCIAAFLVAGNNGASYPQRTKCCCWDA